MFSCGIALAYRKSISQYINPLVTESKLVLWFTVSKNLTKFDLLCGIIYIPPEASEYSVKEPYHEIENELYKYTDRYDHILLLGDFNSRTKNRQDYIHIDPYISSHFDSEEMELDCQKELSFFEKCNSTVSLQRTSKDKKMNNYGYKMLDFCKCNSLFILNGRVGQDKNSGSCTCKDSSTVDYFLCSANILPLIIDFSVDDFCPTLSDVHCPVSLKLMSRSFNKHNTRADNLTKSETIKQWDPNKKDNFMFNFSLDELDRINEQILAAKNKELTQCEINSICDNFNSLITSCAEKSFGKSYTKIDNCDKAPTWFNRDCKKARKQFHRAKYQYKLRKNVENKHRLKTASTFYKSQLKRFHAKFQKDNIMKLKNLKTSNPRKFWKILNGKKKDKANIDPNLFFEFFKDVNFDQNCDNEQPQESFEATQDANNEINLRITENEIKSAINKLKNNKASGIDLIVNEHLKALSHIISPILENLFNLVLDTGLVPECWTLGMIKPIYKNKGSERDPSNYRPITLISCVGKLFTAILNNRIQTYVEDEGLLNRCQSGFRKGQSTIDNIFVLHNLIEIVCKSKLSLYCAFIDLKQAFDKVWRIGLWQKLSKYNINGKCFRVIQSIYKNIKSCVLVNDKKTDFFISNIGVRQGENLSPLLFNLFLNDLEDFLINNNVTGIECREHQLDDTLMVYLEMFILLYADDTVILSDTPEGLQNALSIYSEYCNLWKLKVNHAKSKIIIFSRKTELNYEFILDNEHLEIVTDYKYLGILFSKSNAFYKTIKQLAEQGTRAMYSLLAKARNLRLPIDMQIDLFKKLVKPILLYGCEVWGFGNVDVLERVQLKFIKQVLKLKSCTPNYIVYGEVGLYPLYIDIRGRMVSYWGNVNSIERLGSLANSIYLVARSVYKFGKVSPTSTYFRWMNCIKNILCSTGFSGIWASHVFPNKHWLAKAVKQKYIDAFLNDWYNDVASDTNYRLFKHKFEFERYLITLPPNLLYYLTSFRTRNHRLAVETGRWSKTDHKERKCGLCKAEIGDEYHYLLTCKQLEHIRKEHLKPIYYKRPNTIKYENLMKSKNKATLKTIAKFIKVIYDTVKQ